MMGFIGKDLGCGTYFIEDNAIQYSTVVIIYYSTLHPMFTPDPCVIILKRFI